MIYRIAIWENTTGKRLPAGEMLSDVPKNGRANCAFRYSNDFLARRDSFALDPASLPLKPETISLDNSSIFAIFEDSLPDDWGRRLLVRKHAIPRHEQHLPNLLLALGNGGLGALSFTGNNAHQPSAADASPLHIPALLAAAEKYERGEIQDPELSLLLGAGSSPGGARPKVVIFDKDKSIHYLAKFPSIKDMVDVVRIEAATLNLAGKAGLDVPATRLIQCGGRPVLLVERFDVLADDRRRHMISFQTLLKAQGYYHLRYQDLLSAIRKHSSDPLGDSIRLYRQMVFNVLIGNTDDHLKNFWMLFDHERGWRLSPAFDLVPDIGQRSEHVLLIDLSPYNPGRKRLAKLGKEWGLPNVSDVLEQVYAAVADWRDVFARNGVPEKDIDRFKEIDQFLAL